MKRPNIHRWLLALLFAGVALTACVDEFIPSDDEVLWEEENPFGEGPVLSFVATIDDLGDDDVLNPMEEIENYIDPEKFRILFFTDDSYPDYPNTFLFESKTRFIKKLPNSLGTGSEWRVSVPLFNYGNAVNNGWNWDDIRVYLRDHKFKIAVLANRPENEWSMRIVGKTSSTANTTSKDENHKYDYSDNPNDVIVPGAWYDNSYPHWVAENSLFKRAPGAPAGSPEDTELKTLFDLHHCQYDPIYDGKNWNVAGMIEGVSNSQNYGTQPADKFDTNEDGSFVHENLHVYDFVSTFTDASYTAGAAGPVLKEGRYPKMGSTSSWVSWAGFDGALADENIWNSSPFPADGWIFKDMWADLINEIAAAGGSGYSQNFEYTKEGLTIQKTGNSLKATTDKTGFDTNDSAGTTGKNRLCFSFTLPAGNWIISANVAYNSSGTATPKLCIEVGDGEDYDEKSFTNTTSKDITFKTISVTKSTPVYVYALGRTYFYSIKCVSADSGSMDLSQYNNKDHWNWGFRRSIHPKKSYPIPMYGIQRFDPIGTEWDWGSNYTLTNPIFLLRSVVRIDLIVPKALDVKFLTFHYPNIFSRCDPMDVWTPTNELWDNYIKTGKEMAEIRNYGPIARTGDVAQDSPIKDYQQRMSWIYGIWADPKIVGKDEYAWNWNADLLGDASDFPDGDAETTVGSESNGKMYHPHIFNPCVQRNGQIYCEIDAQYPDCIKKEYDGLNDLYVIYTGERNINDPSNFTRLGNSAKGGPTIAYFLLGVGSDAYTIPLVNYNNSEISSRTDVVVKQAGYGPNGKTPENVIANSYEQAVMASGTDKNNLRPYPLIRNHRYIFRVTGFKTETRGGEEGLSVTSEVRHSKFVRPEVAPKLEK